MVSIHSIHVITTFSLWENTLHIPAQLHSVGCPLLVIQLTSSTFKLAAAIHIEEQELVGTTVTLDVLAITGPIKIGDEGLMGTQFPMHSVVVALNVEDVDVVVVGADCQPRVVWVVFEHLNPFLTHFLIEDVLI